MHDDSSELSRPPRITAANGRENSEPARAGAVVPRLHRPGKGRMLRLQSVACAVQRQSTQRRTGKGNKRAAHARLARRNAVRTVLQTALHDRADRGLEDLVLTACTLAMRGRGTQGRNPRGYRRAVIMSGAILDSTLRFDWTNADWCAWSRVPMNLTQRPPRSPRVRLGGYVHLPRLLDKARAAAAGTLGDYIYPCPLDRLFFEFTGVTPEQILELVKQGRGDGEVLAWIREHAPLRRAEWEIAAWSAWMEARAPSSVDGFVRAADMLRGIAPHRDDVRTGFDRLDLDDHVSFGGKA